MPVYVSELLFLDFTCDNVKGPWLPNNGNVLRCFFDRSRSHPQQSPRAVARHVVNKCIKIWNNRGIPTIQDSNGIKYLLKMLAEFNVMRTVYSKQTEVQRRQTLAVWRVRYELLFSIATKDALDKCDEVSRALLLEAKEREKEFRKAVRNGTLIEQAEPETRTNKPDGPKSSKLSKAKSAGLQGKDRPGPKSSKRPKLDAPTIVTPSALFQQDAAATRPSVIENSSANKTVWVGEFGQRFPVGVVKTEPVMADEQSSFVKNEIYFKCESSDDWPTELLCHSAEQSVPPAAVQKNIIVKEDLHFTWHQADIVHKENQHHFG